MCTHIFATKVFTNLRLEEQGDPFCDDIVIAFLTTYTFFKCSYGGNNERTKCLFI